MASKTKTTKIHVLDDNRNPFGPVLCGRTSTQVVTGALRKGDVVCPQCATALLFRVNDYAGQIDMLTGLVSSTERLVLRQERLLALLSDPLPDPDGEPDDDDIAEDVEPGDDQPVLADDQHKGEPDA